MPRKFERSKGALRVREVSVTYVSPPSPTSVVTEASFAAEVFACHFDTTRQVQELLMAMFLDSRGRLIAVEALYRGTVNSALVGTRDVLRSALMLNAVSFVLAHLHPSGDPEPSAEDLVFTRKLVEAARQLEINLHDHLVLGVTAEGDVRFVSFRQRGLI